ncbi:hypothetical protein D3C78_840290 [compost metagenome]
MTEFHALAVDVVIHVVVAGAAEQLGTAAQRILVSGGQTFRVDVAVPDHVGHAEPRLGHLAADQVQVLHRFRVEVDVGLVHPDALLGEEAFHGLVGGATIIAAAAGDTDADVDFRVDLAVGTQAHADTLTVLVTAIIHTCCVTAIGAGDFLAQAHIALELGLGRPGDLFFELGGSGLLCSVFLLLLGQFGLQFGVLGGGDRAVGLEHLEQFCIDSRAGRYTHGQQQAGAQTRSNVLRNNTTHQKIPLDNCWRPKHVSQRLSCVGGNLGDRALQACG